MVKKERQLALSGGIAITLIAFLGWRLLLFITDDAFIAFRYVDQAMRGHGLVWNPAPFAPVEGYTSFLWVAILWVVWALTEFSPPESVHFLSFLCGLLTLRIIYLAVRRYLAVRYTERGRILAALLVCLAVVLHRQFLTWLSSGLETALFVALVTWWMYGLLQAWSTYRTSGTYSVNSLFVITISSTLMSLTRPDGYLAVVCTIPLLVHAFFPDQRGSWRTRIASLSPYVLLLAHLVWRRWFYGAWLPNTYYAKSTGWWWDMGWRYALSFFIEYGMWVWLALAMLVLIAHLRKYGRGAAAALSVSQLPVACLAAFLIAHFLYYTFRQGGDHFEYRVYAHLVPVGLVLLWVLTDALRLRSYVTRLVFLAAVLCTLPVQWTHWYLGKDARDEQLKITLAPVVPSPVRPLFEFYDAMQAELIEHLVCVRQPEHRAFAGKVMQQLPSREVLLNFAPASNSVTVGSSVGIMGWRLPHIAVIDRYGLTDAVIARSPYLVEPRLMAHSREAPPGYIACFRQNVFFEWTSDTTMAVVHRPRKEPLQDRDVVRCQARGWYSGSR